MVTVTVASRLLNVFSLACPLLAAVHLQPAVQQARDFYYKGIYGDKTAGEKADDLFSELHKQQPDDPLITVYFGSLRLLEAQHTWAIWRKNSLSKQGIHMMDQAVAECPKSLEIRFIRAATERNLPSFFGRQEQAASDLNYIVQHAPEAVQKGEFEPRLAAATFFFYGDWCRAQSRLQDAKQAWEMAVNIAPSSNGGRKSSAELTKIAKRG